ncbi:transposase [mine drainage metagenome]|jgi:transposase|uniref:Transposase n=1 Tax=mine drainage metagenome TaxID=410659 RepID=A0A1J5R1G9_9ZZZZ
MSVSRRKFTTEYKVQAAHRVIDSGRTVTEVARELGLVEVTLGNWVRAERLRMQAVEGSDVEPLSGAERVELMRLRKHVGELEKDLAFLGKAAAYFASNPPKQSGLR